MLFFDQLVNTVLTDSERFYLDASRAYYPLVQRRDEHILKRYAKARGPEQARLSKEEKEELKDADVELELKRTSAGHLRDTGGSHIRSEWKRQHALHADPELDDEKQQRTDVDADVGSGTAAAEVVCSGASGGQRGGTSTFRMMTTTLALNEEDYE